jgi:hypothetical protein
MKIILIMLVCSFASGTCTPPLVVNERFDNMYDCLMRGYEESIKMTQEVGREEINKQGLFTRFACREITETNT